MLVQKETIEREKKRDNEKRRKMKRKEKKRKKRNKNKKIRSIKKGKGRIKKKGKVTPDRSYPSRNAASAGFISLNVLSFNGKGGGEKEKKKGGGKGPHTPCSLRLNTAAACN